MPLYTGKDKIKGVYIGKDKIKEIYLGNEKVFSPPVTILSHRTLKYNINDYFTFDNNLLNLTRNGPSGLINYAYFVNGHTKQGIKLNGVNQQIQIPNSIFLGTGHTVSIWIKPNFNGYKKFPFITQHTQTNNCYEFHCRENGTIYFVQHYDYSKGFVWKIPEWQKDNWYHVVLSVGGNHARLYINGISYGFSCLLSQNTLNNPTYIGGDLYGYAMSMGFFDGIIDEVGLWSRGITLDEVKDLYNNGEGIRYN